MFSGKHGSFRINSVPESGLPTQYENNTLKCSDFSINPLEQFRRKNNKTPKIPPKASNFPLKIYVFAVNKL
jgi:hypothetical protein